MIIHSNSGIAGDLIDLDTNRPIRFAFWANTETGEYLAWVTTPDGERIATPRRQRGGRARLSFVAKRSGVKLLQPSAVDARAATEEVIDFRRAVNPRLLIAGDYCEVRGCNQLAGWTVAETQMLSPIRLPDGILQERRGMTRVRNFCSKHYRLPTVKNERGVESEANIILARPQ